MLYNKTYKKGGNMKKNGIIKIQMIMLIIITIFSLSSTTIYASDFVEKADEFLQAGQGGSTITISESTTKTMSDTIYNILLAIAIIIAVIWGAAIGIQYIMGSVSEKVKVKESLIPYVAGCIVVFGAFTIWKVVVTILQSTT